MRRLHGFLLALLLCAPVARADSIADEADFRFKRAARLYRERRIEEALGEFLASNRLVRNRNVIYNIARCFEALEHYNEAYRWYTEILHDEMPEGDRKDLTDALKRLLTCIGRLEPDRQRMLLLAYYGAFSRDQLAVKLDTSADLLKVSLRRSLSEIEQCLTS